MSLPESSAETAAADALPPAKRPPRIWLFIGTSLWGLLAFGAMFEGFLFGTYNFPLFGLFIYGVLLTFLLDYANKKQQEQLQPQMQYLEEQYEYEPIGTPELAGAPQHYL